MRGLIFLPLLLTCAFFFVSAADTCSDGSLPFFANLSAPNSSWNHYWEECVGSDHALQALRSDYRDALILAHDNLGFKRVRFHGLFDDDMSVVLNGTYGQLVYSFYDIDTIFDFLVSIGMQPLVELSFMPDLIASGNQTVFHYKGNITPPKNWTQWADLLINFAQHIIDRYGAEEVEQWHFEVWNEPNCGFWTGTQLEYFELLKTSWHALKSVNPRLSVGGPATCQSQWLGETLDYARANDFALDFVSTHEYPTDIEPLTRDVMKTVLTKSRETVGTAMPLFYTEYNDGLFYPGKHDKIYASSFAVFNIIEVYGLVDIFSWWTFSDIFEEQGLNSTLFNEGFGLQTLHQIAKPSFRAFELLHQTGDTRFNVTGDGLNSPTAGLVVTTNSTTLSVLMYNYNIPNATIENETLCVQITGLDANKVHNATLRRIDEDHCNPLPVWEEMGYPTYPTQEELDKLKQVSQFVWEELPFNIVDESTISFQVTIPPLGVAGAWFSLN
eukprot:TRINITY_DN15937_c0_g1_i1.p1 TRINITY_DN15937_c0_g1~~TRINITY_DN15937_c0_g1_i1.p1  ORF type:complete len:499 (-),score=97.32 TRINITY_DN15937_c0_g1_i1:6-1502(-)